MKLDLFLEHCPSHSDFQPWILSVSHCEYLQLFIVDSLQQQKDLIHLSFCDRTHRQPQSSMERKPCKDYSLDNMAVITSKGHIPRRTQMIMQAAHTGRQDAPMPWWVNSYSHVSKNIWSCTWFAKDSWLYLYWRHQPQIPQNSVYGPDSHGTWVWMDQMLE